MKLFYNVIRLTALMFTAKMTQGSPVALVSVENHYLVFTEAVATPWILFKEIKKSVVLLGEGREKGG